MQSLPNHYPVGWELGRLNTSASLFPSINLIRVPLLVECNPKPEGKKTLSVVYVCLVCVCVCVCVYVCSLVMKQVKRVEGGSEEKHEGHLG